MRYGLHSGQGAFDKIKPTDSGRIRYESGGYVTATFKYQFKKRPLVFSEFEDDNGADFTTYINKTNTTVKTARIMCKKHSAIGDNPAIKNTVNWVAFERYYST